MNPQLLVEGGAEGADYIARMWAVEHNIPEQVFFARWKEEGTSAGPKRNQRMLAYLLTVACDYDVSILAMPGGAGTADMVRQGQQGDVPVFGPEHGSFYADEPYNVLTWKMLSLRALNNFYELKAQPLKRALKDVVEQTQNDETYSGRRVPPARWNEAKRSLDFLQQQLLYEEQDVPF
jgi:hypothetical protein